MSPTIAIVGASSKRAKYGNKSVRAYLRAGYSVHPVNPHDDEIEGQKVYAELSQVPGDLDRISIYLPPVVTRELLPQIAVRGAGEVWFNPGTSTPDLLDQARTMGIEVRDGCSIVDLGMTPADFP